MSDYSATFPPQRPVFNADFSNSSKLDSRTTFTRSSTGSYFGTSKHLSSENLIPNSNASQAWQTVRVTRTTSGSFLDGSNSFLIAEKSDTGSHYTSPNSSVNATNFVSGTEYTAVVYAKAGTDNVIQLAFPAGYFTSNAYANFDLSNASTTPVTGSAATATITALGSDWVKLTLTAPATATGAGVGIVVAFIQNDINGARIPVYAGDTASNVYLWEANVSSTGQKFLVETDGQIHREYAPTLVSKANNAARFDYSPSDNTSLGCLIEGQSTNLYSNSLDMTGVSGARTHVDSNAAVGPTGGLTADALRLNDTNANTHYREYSFTAAASTTYTFSVYLKAAGLSHAAIRSNNLFSTEYVHFNLSNGTVEGSPSLSNSMTSVGNGWYRCSVTATTTGSGAASFVIYITDSAASTIVATGDSYRAILGQAIQIEAGSHPSSFIETSGGATATRASDSMSVGLSDIGQDPIGNAVSAVAEFDTNASDAQYRRVMVMRDGTTGLRIDAQAYSGNGYVFVANTSGGTTELTSKSGITTGYHKVAIGLDGTTANASFDGATAATMSNADTASVQFDTLQIGSYSATQLHLDGHIRNVSLFNVGLSASNVEALTS